MDAEQNRTSAVTQALHRVIPIHQYSGVRRYGIITNTARQKSAPDRERTNLENNFTFPPSKLANLPVCSCSFDIILSKDCGDDNEVPDKCEECDEVLEDNPEADWIIGHAVYHNNL